MMQVLDPSIRRGRACSKKHQRREAVICCESKVFFQVVESRHCFLDDLTLFFVTAAIRGFSESASVIAVVRRLKTFTLDSSTCFRVRTTRIPKIDATIQSRGICKNEDTETQNPRRICNGGFLVFNRVQRAHLAIFAKRKLPVFPHHCPCLHRQLHRGEPQGFAGDGL